MSKLEFKINLTSGEVDVSDLPVEIRRRNLTVAATSIASQSVELEPDTYVVTARLPAGQVLEKRVVIRQGQDATVLLRPNMPSEGQERQFFFRSAQGKASDQMRPAKGKLRALRGNLLKGFEVFDPMRSRSWGQSVVSRGALMFAVPGSTTLQLVQLIQPGQPVMNRAIPVSADHGCRLVLSRTSKDSLALDVELEHKDAELLLCYYENSDFEQAEILLKKLGGDLIERNLRSDRQDPIAACVGMYVALRLGQLGPIGDWNQFLCEKFSWLPDGLVLRAEYLAREGHLDRAVDLLMKLPERGMPLFSDGLTFVLERLYTYASIQRSAREKAKGWQLPDWFGPLQKFSTFVDYTKPLLTFTGYDPRRPDDNILKDSIEQYDGDDLSGFLVS